MEEELEEEKEMEKEEEKMWMMKRSYSQGAAAATEMHHSL